MRTEHMTTRIFLDSGSAEHTRDIIEKIGFLDGQTTNPTYFVTKNPEIQKSLAAGKKFTTQELLDAYKILASTISSQLPEDGSVSIEVYADFDTTAEEMIEQGKKMNAWIPNAHIKLPIIPEGLRAAQALVQDGINVNMTLCFSQDQAAAVHAATKGAKKGQVFVSPFVSRLDKIGQNGFDLLLNVKKMYSEINSHVEILAASVHDVYDIAHIIETGMDIITIPYDDMLAWIDEGMPKTTENCTPKQTDSLSPIEYKDLNLTLPYTEFELTHNLTDQGLIRFANDWNNVLV